MRLKEVNFLDDHAKLPRTIEHQFTKTFFTLFTELSRSCMPLVLSIYDICSKAQIQVHVSKTEYDYVILSMVINTQICHHHLHHTHLQGINFNKLVKLHSILVYYIFHFISCTLK